MKKLMLMIAIMLIAITSGIAWAGSTNPCSYSCLDQEVGQISYCNNDNCTCDNFDYEAQTGYCKDFNAPKGIVFKLCDCEEVNSIDPNEEYYLNVVILTPGVYWNCINPSVPATPIDVGYAEITTYADINEVCNDLNGDSTVVPISAFRDINKIALVDYAGNAGSADCEIPEDKAVCFSTTPAQIFKAQRSFILVDIPEMFYDKNLVGIGTEVKISIQLKRPGTVCVSCPGFCSCIGSVGVFGCTETVCTFNLPYLLPNGGAWWNGLVLSNISSQPNIITVKFHDGLGGEAVYVKTFEPFSLSSLILADYLAECTGDDLSEADLLTAQVFGTAACSAVVIIGETNNTTYGYVSRCLCCNAK